MGKVRLLAGEELSQFARDQQQPRLLNEADEALRQRLREHIAVEGWKKPSRGLIGVTLHNVRKAALAEGVSLAESQRRETAHLMTALGRAASLDVDDGHDDLRDAMRSRRKGGTWLDED